MRSILAAAVLCALAVLPAAAQDDVHDAVSRAAKAKSARVLTVDGRVLEGKLRADGNGAVSVDGGDPIALASIRTMWVRGRPNREALAVGGFLGGYAGGLFGFGYEDVNSVIATGVGTALGYGVGFAFRDRSTTWDQVYPKPPPQPIAHEGWFLDSGGSVAFTDITHSARADLRRTPDDWFLFGFGGFGRALSPTTAIALQSRSWLEPDMEFDFYDVFTAFTITASWVSSNSGLTLCAGAGPAVGEHNPFRDEGAFADWGWGAMAVTAWEFKVGRHTLLGPMVSFDYMVFDGDFYDEVTVIAVGLRMVTY